MKKYIVSVASCLFALCMQSCFQDMDHPAFDYPESTGEVPTDRKSTRLNSSHIL